MFYSVKYALSFTYNKTILSLYIQTKQYLNIIFGWQSNQLAYQLLTSVFKNIIRSITEHELQISAKIASNSYTVPSVINFPIFIDGSVTFLCTAEAICVSQ